MSARSRREFLADVGRGMLIAGVGSATALELGLTTALAEEPRTRLTFGELEPLVSLLQETPLERLLPVLAEKLQSGTDLKTLVSSAALANARAFGGEDYTGFHTFMALVPAYQMAGELPSARRALPVLKVIYRNSSRIHATSSSDRDVLSPLTEHETIAADARGEEFRKAVHAADLRRAESQFAGAVQESPQAAFDLVQHAIQDEADVHRVVMSWRAWSMLDLTGKEHAETLLRQSVHYCVDVERKIRQRNGTGASIRSLLPQLLTEYRLLERPLGDRKADDAWIDRFARLVYSATREEAATAAAAALAEGFHPESVGEAISLGANLLVLHDPGRLEKWSSKEKPPGCVHGDSVGVHASDAANAWRCIARVGNARNRVAAIIVGAYHTAGQTALTTEEPYPYASQLGDLKAEDAGSLLGQLEEAIRGNDQARACAIADRYGSLSLSVRPLFDVLLKYAVSEDGALHAEKYYRTVAEEFAATRPAFRWRQMIALARVTASEHGFPAPGYAEACELMGVS